MRVVWFQIVLGPVELVDEVDSTNRVLLGRARAGAPHGTVLVADHQTAGRGRLGRTWEAPPGTSLLVSVLLRPAGLPASRAHLLTMAAGLAADACREVAGVRLTLKWPNDLVVETEGGAAKLAGLLAESVLDADRLTAVVLGMGLNIRWSTAPPAGGVALVDLAGRDVDRSVLLDAWLGRLEHWYSRLPAGATALLEEHRARCSTLGQEVRVQLSDRTLHGRATTTTDDGHLVVEVAGGGSEIIAVGDVIHVRPFAAPQGR